MGPPGLENKTDVEFKNSRISTEEFKEREDFYDQVLRPWIGSGIPGPMLRGIDRNVDASDRMNLERHRWFDWKHRREVSFRSTQYVLLDLVVPDNMLTELLAYRDYGDYRPFCIRLVSAKVKRTPLFGPRV